MDSNTEDNQQEGFPPTNKELLIITHAGMAKQAVSWFAHNAKIRNAELFVASCVLNPVAVPGRHAAWTLIEDPKKVRDAVKEAVGALQQETVTLLDEINDVMPSRQVTEMVRRYDISAIGFPLDARLDPSSPDLQFGQQLLHDVPCNVLLIDFGRLERKEVERIVVPMDLNASGHAVRRLVEIGEGLGTVVPIHISPDFGPDSQEIASKELDLQLKEIGIKREYSWLKPQVVIAEGFHHGVMQTIRRNDGIILAGASAKMLYDMKREISAFRPQLAESIAIAIYRPVELAAKTVFGRIGKRLRATVPELTLADRISLFDRIQGGARLTPDFAVMIGLSVLIASFGLLADNPSVVIGAMLVAPFMTSLIGIGLALVQGNVSLMKRSAIAMGAGLLIGFLLSFMMGLIVPFGELPLEVLARGDPDIVDLVIAFVSGMAAAYAVSRESVTESIVGVAIAAALVPPMACVGIMVSHGSFIQAEGALTLLVTNLAAIILGAAFVFRRLGVPGTRTEYRSYVQIRRISFSLIIAVLILAIPLGYRLSGNLAVGQIRPNSFRVSGSVKRAALEQVKEYEGLHMLYISRSGSGRRKHIRILLTANETVQPDVLEGIRAAVKELLGEESTVEIHVFQSAVRSVPGSDARFDKVEPDKKE
ncbi:MAG: TIGR00341 family protein [Planctomycetota bacterium]|jgi:uncharacterized hydrophobic protein (TIGR00271 family)